MQTCRGRVGMSRRQERDKRWQGERVRGEKGQDLEVGWGKLEEVMVQTGRMGVRYRGDRGRVKEDAVGWVGESGK